MPKFVYRSFSLILTGMFTCALVKYQDPMLHLIYAVAIFGAVYKSE